MEKKIIITFKGKNEYVISAFCFLRNLCKLLSSAYKVKITFKEE